MKRKYSYLILTAMFLMLINIGYQVIYVPDIRDRERALLNDKLYWEHPAAYYDEETQIGISGCSSRFDSELNCIAAQSIGAGLRFSTQKTDKYNYRVDVAKDVIWVEDVYRYWIDTGFRPYYYNYGGLQVIGY